MREAVHVMYSEQEIHSRVEELAGQINKDYRGKPIHLICILKGSVFFCCELAKRLTMPVTFDFMAVSSYGSGTKGSGEITMKKDLDSPICGLDCLVVEDIIDTGNTFFELRPLLMQRQPNSLRLCTLLDKPDRREADVAADYTGFIIPDEFVVGYGMDYAEKYRNLPYIGRLEFLEE